MQTSSPMLSKTATSPAADAAQARSSWLWPLRPFTFCVAACVLAIAFVVCFPAIEVPHAEVDSDGKYGPHFGIEMHFEHGWPARYAARRSWHSPTPDVYEQRSAWQPWDNAYEQSVINLVFDVVFWTSLVAAAVVGAQYWRSRREFAWQLNVRDLLVLTGVLAAVFAWFTNLHRQNVRERRILLDSGQNVIEDRFVASLPALLPESVRIQYCQRFGRAGDSFGYSSAMGQLPGLLVLMERQPDAELARTLRDIPQLEALDFSMAIFSRSGGPDTKTVLSDFPPMPNLRGINLYETNVTDADLQWLASCPRLEHIDLTGTDIGDEGLAHLSNLKRLRILSVSGDRITDEGCRSLAEIQSLERLGINGGNIRASGVQSLGELRNLQSLEIGAFASTADFEALQQTLPRCEIFYVEFKRHSSHE